MAEKPIDETTGTVTTGHDWDGIKELNTPLPRWWLWTFYVTLLWGLGYTIAYPAWPLINGATEGLLGWSTRANVAEAIKEHEAKNADLAENLVSADLSELAAGDDLHRYAVARGGSVFRAQCSQCHGSGAGGAKGYPSLLDKDWIWGGSMEEIAFSIDHGIRNDTDDDSRYSEMPEFLEILEEDEIRAIVENVLSLNASNDFDAALASEGATLFEENCASCHGDEGLGDRDLGAPNLADAVWIWGGSREDLTESVTNSRYGVMPAWGQRLNEVDVRAVAVYVHSLGGGE